MLTTTQLPTQFTRAAFQPETFRAESKTVELVWTTGAQVRRYDWMEGPYLEELTVDPAAVRLDRLNNGAPLLSNHDTEDLEDVIGVVERAWIADGKGYAQVRFSDREEVQAVLADVASGILRNVSVGYQVHEYEITAPQDGSLPTYRAVDWEPYELSLVTIPADMKAQVRGTTEDLHPVTLTTRNSAMADQVENEIPAEDVAPETVEEQAVEEPEQVDIASEVRKAVVAERKRAATIRDDVRMAKLDEAYAERLIDSGKSLDECRHEILRAWSEKVDASATASGRPEHQPSAAQTRSAEIRRTLLNQVAGIK